MRGSSIFYFLYNMFNKKIRLFSERADLSDLKFKRLLSDNASSKLAVVEAEVCIVFMGKAFLHFVTKVPIY